VSELEINCELAEQIICGFLKDEVSKVGFSRVVVGMSGGLDSSCTAALTVRALGPDNCVGVMMPYKTSSPDSLEDAQTLASQLGMETITVDITRQIDAYFDGFPEADQRRRGNKMARERMAILYDLSAARDALVVGTSNKTEILLGYTTLWGDMACAVMPLGDLYKTQVRQLARYLGVPEKIVAKPPTADLWVGQTDEGELGFTYADADRLLYRIVDLRWSRQRCIEEGFAPKLVDAVTERMRRTQYKRRLPIVCKLSGRTVDRDFRYPRDWGY
jgi:NAD+ synthase